MRLFAAVLPPAGAVAELAAAVDRLRALPGAEDLRWTDRAGWHFTLAFMGEVDDELLPDLQDRLARAARRTAPFPLRLHGGGHFGDRALWAGAAGGLDELRLLAERSYAAARRAKIAMAEHRRYTAHLTIARSRTDGGLRAYVDELSDFEGTTWVVEQLTLVRSNLPVSGVSGEQPRYENVGIWNLGAGTKAASG
ncbi:RNA 2',3'-cyclic phosphodiesterase [Streptomyces albipurpureus]|uniref:RNA 2',3'-cyclic phosphodiesterase n=1 Tax=Streptomyces albipurpureus TaxID=2897419 RepID=A0ABT0UTC4_9ACTN|nr:RNA 2',3'-cyclic phosphodiesterase [Streptomyces sp. CWNU-1]MCM2391852.1 RNA 2',3'-cyclic phosphodiesterase [Streptomyces sp. CWNU-1]